MKKYNDIGDLYRDKFSGYSPEPPADVWNNIQGKVKGKTSLWKTVGLPVVGAIIVGLTAYLLFTNPQTETSATLLTENNQEMTTIANSNDNQEELTTNETPIQNHNFITTIPLEKQGSTSLPQNQETTPTQSEDKTNDKISQDNSFVKDENQPINTRENTVNQVVETPRVSENPPSETRPAVQSKPSKPVIISRDTTICENTSAQLYIYNAQNIRWSTDDTKNKITVSPSYSERYSVSFTTEEGKDSIAFVYVNVTECTEVHIPNLFTPNGDGLNDMFIAMSNMDLDYFEMTIYSADGRQILFSSKNINQGWNGTYRGQRQPHGVYYYNIRYKDSFGKIIEKRGELLLILQ